MNFFALGTVTIVISLYVFRIFHRKKKDGFDVVLELDPMELIYTPPRTQKVATNEPLFKYCKVRQRSPGRYNFSLEREERKQL